MKPDCEKRLAVVIGGVRDQCPRLATGTALVVALGPSQRCSVDAGRGRALACAAGHRESSEARKWPQGGGVERRAYSLRSNIVSETEERLRGVSRRVVVDGGASDALHGKSRAA